VATHRGQPLRDAHDGTTRARILPSRPVLARTSALDRLDRPLAARPATMGHHRRDGNRSRDPSANAGLDDKGLPTFAFTGLEPRSRATPTRWKHPVGRHLDEETSRWATPARSARHVAPVLRKKERSKDLEGAEPREDWRTMAGNGGRTVQTRAWSNANDVGKAGGDTGRLRAGNILRGEYTSRGDGRERCLAAPGPKGPGGEPAPPPP
jgi:hypothetical protein